MLKERSPLPLKTGTRNKSRTNCCRKDANGYSNHLGLHTPVGSGTCTALKAILGNSLVDEEVLTTVLTEVKSILNSRPLSPASDDPKDFEPLTPNHLLLQRPVHTLPPGSFVKEDILVRKKWRQAQILADHFWKRWLKEYVPALQKRQKWHRPRQNA